MVVGTSIVRHLQRLEFVHVLTNSERGSLRFCFAPSRQSVVDCRPLRRRLAKRIRIQSLFMKKTRRNRRQVRSLRESHVLQVGRLPAMMTEMMFSSFETIARRGWMLAQGKCSPTECARMVMEKQQALALSGLALLSGASAASILAPFHRGATANAKRLRGKGN
jgi:hypothetical protein